MAKIKLSTLFTELYGRVGGLVFKRSRRGKTIIARSPNMSRVRWSQAQKAHRQRFREAVTYAHAALKDPERSALYEKIARERDSTPFNMAVSDYFAVLRNQKE